MVTPGEISFFNANGYLQIESFLAPDHIDQLLSALEKLVEQRRWFVEQSELDANKEGIDPSREELSGREQNKSDGENVRVKYLLEQDPLFLDLLDYPPILPYIHEFLSKNRISMRLTRSGKWSPESANPAGTGMDMTEGMGVFCRISHSCS